MHERELRRLVREQRDLIEVLHEEVRTLRKLRRYYKKNLSSARAIMAEQEEYIDDLEFQLKGGWNEPPRFSAN